MAVNPDVGTGATVTFAGLTLNLLNISHNDISRPKVGTSHLGTVGGRTYIPTDTYEPGELELEVQFDGKEPLLNKPPWENAAGTLDLEFEIFTAGNTTKAKLTATAFCTAFNYGVPFDELMTGTVVFAFSGDLTYSDEAA